MLAGAARSAPRFVRRTQLGENEYHTNFRKIDCDIISRLTSDEAGRVTSQMCKVYLTLLNAPTGCWERPGVLRFAGEERDGSWTTAWAQLLALLGVASATARKALLWMHEEGIIGYFAGKNGVGIRVFINRASSSIGQRPREGQKNLRLVRASHEVPRASNADTPFMDSFAGLEVLETLNPRAPKNGAGQTDVFKIPPRTDPASPPHAAESAGPREGASARAAGRVEIPLGEIVSRLGRELEPTIRCAAREAAAQEHERTREWLESRGLPKAARVAQREAFNVLRQHGLVRERAGNSPAQAAVGRHEPAPPEPQRLPDEAIDELAQACLALLESQGKPLEATLSEMRVEAGGFLLAEDVARLRERARALCREAHVVKKE